jgi:hypothetical protein
MQMHSKQLLIILEKSQQIILILIQKRTASLLTFWNSWVVAMKEVIRELEIKKNKAFEYMREGSAYHSGEYSAYHTAIELIKRAEQDKNKVVD